MFYMSQKQLDKERKEWKITIIITLILSTIVLVGGLLLVNHFKNKEDVVYMTNEEFFTYYTQEMGLETKLYTEEEYANADVQMLMAVLVENGCLTQEETNVDLTAPVTQETVVLVCARGSKHLPTGDVDEIRNADKLKEPQLIADAYKAKFFELKFGKFDEDKQMTAEEVQAIINATKNYNALFVVFDKNSIAPSDEDKNDLTSWYK